MKKLIIFFAFASFISNAQSRFIKLDSAQLIKHVESFIWLTEVNYVADKNSFDWGYNNYQFVNPKNEKDLFTIRFERRADGFDIVRVSGTFNSLFKIWKSDFDRKADANTVKNTGFAINGRTKFNKNKDGDYRNISSL